MNMTKKLCLLSLITILFVPICKCVHVDTSARLSQKEIDYIKKRKPKTEQAQDRLTGRTLSKHSNMGLCLSGGGYRAMISSLGFLIGAEEIGLLDSANYSSSLSGSTWNIGSILARRPYTKKQRGFLKRFRPKLQQRVSKSFWDPRTLNWTAIIKRLAVKWEEYRTIQPADVWGAILIDRLMGDLPDGGQNITFANIRSLLKKDTQYPFPLFAATIKDTFPIEGEYEWFEVNPFYSGSDYLDGFIPTKYLGSVFEDGNLTERKAEENLGFFLAIFGSPYDLNVGDILLQAEQLIPETVPFKSLILDCLHVIIKDCGLAKKNLLPSKISNLTCQMSSSPYQEELLTLADAGFDFNLSAPPLLKRKTDIIVCCDDSSDAEKKGFPELKLVKRYADRHGIIFPSFSRYKKINRHLFIFKWNDDGQASNDIPTVIYFCNPIAESTLKLQYSKKEFDELCDFMKNLVIESKSTIANEIIAKNRS